MQAFEINRLKAELPEGWLFAVQNMMHKRQVPTHAPALVF